MFHSIFYSMENEVFQLYFILWPILFSHLNIIGTKINQKRSITIITL